MHLARTLTLALTLAALLPPVGCTQGQVAEAAPDAPSLAGRSLEHWAGVLEPAPEDRAWLDIPWHASFHDGLRAAEEAGRPLLLWLMNGHPLGCT